MSNENVSSEKAGPEMQTGGGCPMASMCAGMAEKGMGRLGFVPFLLGAFLVVMGVLVVAEPQILTWLAAIVLGLAGIAVIAAGWFMRRMFAGGSTG